MRCMSLSRLMAVGKMRNCGMWNVKCEMETVERCCGTVGEMRNAEICHMWVIVCPRHQPAIAKVHYSQGLL